MTEVEEWWGTLCLRACLCLLACDEINEWGWWWVWGRHWWWWWWWALRAPWLWSAWREHRRQWGTERLLQNSPDRKTIWKPSIIGIMIAFQHYSPQWKLWRVFLNFLIVIIIDQHRCPTTLWFPFVLLHGFEHFILYLISVQTIYYMALQMHICSFVYISDGLINQLWNNICIIYCEFFPQNLALYVRPSS